MGVGREWIRLAIGLVGENNLYLPRDLCQPMKTIGLLDKATGSIKFILSCIDDLLYIIQIMKTSHMNTYEVKLKI